METLSGCEKLEKGAACVVDELWQWPLNAPDSDARSQKTAGQTKHHR
jgi:hypothetical protein